MIIEYCLCGHPSDRHFEGPIAARCTWCLLAKEPAWHDFKRDNIRYLEQRHEESVKNGK
jgi:hypothetical protein